MKMNVGALLGKRAILNPDLEALVDTASGARLSYKELDDRCNQVANALRGLGVKKGDRVALLAMNSTEFVETFYAIAKIGAVCVPLNWRLVADELAFILKDSGATVLLYGEEFSAIATELHARGASGSDVREWITIGKADPFAHSHDAFRDAAPTDAPALEGEEHDNLYIMYTSGTTGLPKGVVHTHSTTMWSIITASTTSDMSFRDRYYIILPLFHVGALNPLMSSIYGGVTAVIARAFDPTETWNVIEREKITNMLAVPAMLNFMYQVPKRKEADYSTLSWIMSGAAPVPKSLIEAYAEIGIEIHQVYGLTETCGPGCLISPTDALRKAGSTGKAFMHNDVKIVDENGNEVGPGVVGEVWLNGPHIMKEYWNRPDATAESLQDGWLRTGDVAVMDDEGFVYIQDRIKDMIISGGENIYPAEIENVILQHPGVKEVAVIGQPSKKWGESAFAVVVKADDALTEADVLKFADGKLARFKQPRAAGFVDEIPRNPSGKALKRILREQFPGPAPE